MHKWHFRGLGGQGFNVKGLGGQKLNFCGFGCQRLYFESVGSQGFHFQGPHFGSAARLHFQSSDGHVLPYLKCFAATGSISDVSVPEGSIFAVSVGPFEALAAKVPIFDLDRRPDSVSEVLAAKRSILEVSGAKGCFFRSGRQRFHLRGSGSLET